MDEENRISRGEHLLLSSSAEENNTTENVSIELQMLRPSTSLSYTARRVAGISGSDIPFIDQSQVASPSSNKMSPNYEGTSTSQSFAARAVAGRCGSSLRFIDDSTVTTASPASQSLNVAPLIRGISNLSDGGGSHRSCHGRIQFMPDERIFQLVQIGHREEPVKLFQQTLLLLACLFHLFFAISFLHEALPPDTGFSLSVIPKLDFRKGLCSLVLFTLAIGTSCFICDYCPGYKRYPLDTTSYARNRVFVVNVTY